MTETRSRDPLVVVAAGVAGLSLVFSIAALAIASARSGPERVVAGSSAAPAAPGPIAVTASDFSFTPKRLSAVAGPVRIVVKNTGAVVHNIEIPEVGKSPDVAPGATVEWAVGELAAGTYQLNCVVSGHKEAGMVATLIVR